MCQGKYSHLYQGRYSYLYQGKYSYLYQGEYSYLCLKYSLNGNKWLFSFFFQVCPPSSSSHEKRWKLAWYEKTWNDNDLAMDHDWGSGARMAPLDLQKFQLGLNSQPDLRPIPNFARVPQKRPLSPCFGFIFQRCIEFEMAFVLFYSQAVIQSVETLKAWLDAMINWALGKNLGLRN